MTGYGYTLMTEQSGPRELVGHAAAAEGAGFADVALVQIGDESQRDFLAIAEKELLPALRG